MRGFSSVNSIGLLCMRRILLVFWFFVGGLIFPFHVKPFLFRHLLDLFLGEDPLGIAEDGVEEGLNGELAFVRDVFDGVALAEVFLASRVADGAERLALWDEVEDGIPEDVPREAPVEVAVCRGEARAVEEELVAGDAAGREALAELVEERVEHVVADLGEIVGIRVGRNVVHDRLKLLDLAAGRIAAVEGLDEIESVLGEGGAVIPLIGGEHGDGLLLRVGIVLGESDVEVGGLDHLAEDVHRAVGGDERIVFLILADKGDLLGRLVLLGEELLELDAEHVAANLVVGSLELLVAAVQLRIEVAEEVGLLRDYHRVVAVFALLLILVVVRKDLLVFLPVGWEGGLGGAFYAVDLLADYLAQELYSVVDRGFLLLLPRLVEYRGHGVEDCGAVRESADAGAESFEDRCRDVGGRHLRGRREAFFVKYDVVLLMGAFDEVRIVRSHNDVTIDSWYPRFPDIY